MTAASRVAALEDLLGRITRNRRSIAGAAAHAVAESVPPSSGPVTQIGVAPAFSLPMPTPRPNDSVAFAEPREGEGPVESPSSFSSLDVPQSLAPLPPLPDLAEVAEVAEVAEAAAIAEVAVAGEPATLPPPALAEAAEVADAAAVAVAGEPATLPPPALADVAAAAEPATLPPPAAGAEPATLPPPAAGVEPATLPPPPLTVAVVAAEPATLPPPGPLETQRVWTPSSSAEPSVATVALPLAPLPPLPLVPRVGTVAWAAPVEIDESPTPTSTRVPRPEAPAAADVPPTVGALTAAEDVLAVASLPAATMQTRAGAVASSLAPVVTLPQRTQAAGVMAIVGAAPLTERATFGTVLDRALSLTR